MKISGSIKNILIFALFLLTISSFIFSYTLIKKIDETKNHIQGDTIRISVSSPIISKDLDFCGELVPLHDYEIKERLDRELIVNTYWHSNTILSLKRANRWFPIISEILKKNGIPDDFKFVALIESSLTNAISPAGAKGYWQFMKDAANGYGLIINKEVDERYNIEKATEAACKYIKDSYKIFNNWTLTAASYNMGMGGLSKRLSFQKVDNYYDLFLNEETSRYIFRIMAMKEIYNFPERYGFSLNDDDLYPKIETKLIKISKPIPSLVNFAKSQNITYKTLKNLNPWLIDSVLTNRQNLTFHIKVPVEISNN